MFLIFDYIYVLIQTVKAFLKYFSLLLVIFIATSCNHTGNDDVYYQKPKGYQRIDLPEHRYQVMNEKLPYSFEYSTSAVIRPDKSPEAEPNWIIVDYPKLNAMIQFTYKPLHGDLKKLDAHVRDAYKLASKHQIRATSQKENIVNFKNGRQAVVIEIEGEVPSHYQFYTTDTLNHYLRGAVYLKEATLNDSLQPVVDYLKTDARHILETIKWNK